MTKEVFEKWWWKHHEGVYKNIDLINMKEAGELFELALSLKQAELDAERKRLEEKCVWVDDSPFGSPYIIPSCKPDHNVTDENGYFLISPMDIKYCHHCGKLKLPEGDH
jgi:hypothetical protein